MFEKKSAGFRGDGLVIFIHVGLTFVKLVPCVWRLLAELPRSEAQRELGPNGFAGGVGRCKSSLELVRNPISMRLLPAARGVAGGGVTAS